MVTPKSCRIGFQGDAVAEPSWTLCGESERAESCGPDLQSNENRHLQEANHKQELKHVHIVKKYITTWWNYCNQILLPLWFDWDPGDRWTYTALQPAAAVCLQRWRKRLSRWTFTSRCVRWSEAEEEYKPIDKRPSSKLCGVPVVCPRISSKQLQ